MNIELRGFVLMLRYDGDDDDVLGVVLGEKVPSADVVREALMQHDYWKRCVFEVDAGLCEFEYKLTLLINECKEVCEDVFDLTAVAFTTSVMSS